MKFNLTINTDDANEVAAIIAALGGRGALTAATTIPPIPATGADDAEDETAPPAVIQPGEVDKNGLPWDARIHSGGKTKTKEGAWRYAKNLDGNVIAAVEAELRARANPTVPVAPVAPVTPPSLPPATTPAVGAPPPSTTGQTVTPPVSPSEPVTPPPPAAAPAVPATPPVATPAGPPTSPIAAGAMNFPELMQHVSNSMQANLIDQEGQWLAWLAGQVGATVITEIAADPGKIAQAYNLLLEHKRIVGIA